MRSHDVVVVGGGHNGLVCAAYLARAGRRVLVLERRDELGGLAQTVAVGPGYRAPAVLHTAERLRTSVVRDLGLHSHGLRVLRPATRAFGCDPDGGGVVLHHDPRETADAMRSRSKEDARAFVAFDARVRAIASFLAHVAAVTPPDVEEPSIGDAFLGVRLGRLLRRLGSRAVHETLRAVPMPVADLVQDSLPGELLRATVASRGVALTSMGPWTAGTACVLLMAATGGGAAGGTAYVEGGPGSLSRSIANAARSSGAEIRTGADVTGILTTDERATGVVLDSGEEIPAPVVVSALDPKRTLSMIDPAVLGPTMVWRKRHLRAPGAVAKVNLALSALPTFRGVDGTHALTGRIVVAPSVAHLERAADDPKYRRISEAPFLEITIPSLTDRSLAPEGGHVASILVHFVPYSSTDAASAEARTSVEKVVLETMDHYASGFGDRVVALQVLLPEDIERDYGPTNGCLQHLEPGLDQFFAWRPMLGQARYRFVVPGLYLAGPGAHPGGGITGAPGANAAREILGRRGSRSGLPRRPARQLV